MPAIKRFIAPFQKVLLSKRLCPGCTMPLDKAEKHNFNASSDMVICSCRRMYVYDKNSDSFRRATFNEAEEFSKAG